METTNFFIAVILFFTTGLIWILYTEVQTRKLNKLLKLYVRIKFDSGNSSSGQGGRGLIVVEVLEAAAGYNGFYIDEIKIRHPEIKIGSVNELYFKLDKDFISSQMGVGLTASSLGVKAIEQGVFVLLKGYLLHDTNKKTTICIRAYACLMRDDSTDIINLY